MRKILFRGKRVDNGRWVYGFYGHKPDRNEVEEHFIIEWEFNDTSDLVHTYFVHTPVIHETVGQYTGYSDKNGMKIFEGDIVNGTGWIGDSITGRVILENGAFYILAYYEELRTLHLLGGLYHDATEVIGNIHDNPELMVSYWKQNPFVRRASNKEG